MEQKVFTTDVLMSEDDFKAFAVFDIFYRLRRWVQIAVFAGILLVCAVICFIMYNRAQHAVMLGVVLSVIALGLPAVYIRSFFNSLKMQAKRLKLNPPRHVYKITLTSEADGICADGLGEENTRYKWGEAHGAYRRSGYTYLYVLKTKAFILPDRDVPEGGDALWQFLGEMLPQEKTHDCRAKKDKK